MTKFGMSILLYLQLVGVVFGQSVCESYGSVKTPKGILERQVCKTLGQPGSSVSMFFLDGKTLLKGANPITFEAENKNATLFALQDSYDPNLACPARMFLIDLTNNKPRVFAFGVKNACAEYHWASWGKKRSVIAIKENIRFTYSNGKLTPPPPDFGDGIPLVRRYPEDAASQRNWPFVEELPIP